MVTLKGLRIEGTGTPESDWARSLGLAALAELDATIWLRGIPRLVVVSPHPDDEVLGCGGVIAHARAIGIDVMIFSVTDGEACYPEDPIWTPARLRATRRGELLRAAARLGVSRESIQALAIGDGCVTACEHALALQLSRLIAATDTVLTTWSRDGHPDHEATSRAVRSAASACGARVLEFPIWAWHWLNPRGDALHDAGALRLTLSASARRAKASALACFASQLGTSMPAAHDPILPPHILQRFARDYEVLIA